MSLPSSSSSKTSEPLTAPTLARRRALQFWTQVTLGEEQNPPVKALTLHKSAATGIAAARVEKSIVQGTLRGVEGRQREFLVESERGAAEEVKPTTTRLASSDVKLMEIGLSATALQSLVRKTEELK